MFAFNSNFGFFAHNIAYLLSTFKIDNHSMILNTIGTHRHRQECNQK